MQVHLTLDALPLVDGGVAMLDGDGSVTRIGGGRVGIRDTVTFQGTDHRVRPTDRLPRQRVVLALAELRTEARLQAYGDQLRDPSFLYFAPMLISVVAQKL